MVAFIGGKDSGLGGVFLEEEAYDYWQDQPGSLRRVRTVIDHAQTHKHQTHAHDAGSKTGLEKSPVLTTHATRRRPGPIPEAGEVLSDNLEVSPSVD
jgi:hypothetical protein